ncbi:hypothetical protein JOY44_02705 [Phormidium sp. CLA17]|uniref:hypothetical protein n=1 Tax=Leptolyngbya sp. Cla-17 TaxID=2803751 RepID=UPI001490C61F|nr:hypothetical protein [Leptolyngbya sp. Cla-17]MBM0740536.1 hypothetical protein [Leptolyngbya sp. Cla-17]
MSSADKSSDKPFLSVQAIVLAEIGWAVSALLFFLLFGVTAEREVRPFWYSLGTSIFEATSYLIAALLCFRNWRSSQIVSGRGVWLGIGLGMFFYFLGNLLFSYWELGLGLEPTVSPADLFFILTYVFLLWGMFQAVFSRRLNLELWQKGIIGAIAIVGIAIAIVLSTAKPAEPPASKLDSGYMAEAPSLKASIDFPFVEPVSALFSTAQTLNFPAFKLPDMTAESLTDAVAQSPPATEPKSQPPEWAVSLEQQLKPVELPINWFYLLCDVLLLVLATTLLLAFWGGRFSQSWRMIAAAAFCLYIADIWFKYATTILPDYKSGGLPEVFWVFSGVLFGIGAALEYDLSSRSRRTGSRRRA